MTQDDSLLARQLDEYRLIASLGRGGMARVYLGLDDRLKRYVAIKTIDKPLRADPDYIKRFEYEAQTIAQLEHPHIVRVYRYGEADGTLYLAMQYIKGASLDSILASYHEDGTFMEPEDAVRIIRELCLALDYAHSQGVIHRDVKPSNVMLNESGELFLADFGLSFYRELDTQDDVFGTPSYMAPEQVLSSTYVVPQSDLYAVGVILYEIFTGQIPFTDEDPMEVARMQMEVEPPRPRSIRSAISPEVEALILKALAKEPQERFPSGAALVAALESAVSQPMQSETTPQHTIPQRVSLLERPLPPLPAAVSKPVPQVSQAELSSAIPEPTTPPQPDLQQRKVLYAVIAVGVVLVFILLLWAVRGLNNQDTEESIAGMSTSTTEAGEAEPTNTMAAEVTPTPAQVANVITPTAPATATATPLIPTETPSPTVTLPPTATPTSETPYRLLIATNGEDSLFVVNQSDVAFPLAFLQLGDGNGAIQGIDWGMEFLEPGSCVTAWKDGGNPQPPSVDCQQVGERLIRDGSNRFWKDAFGVFMRGHRSAVVARRSV